MIKTFEEFMIYGLGRLPTPTNEYIYHSGFRTFYARITKRFFEDKWYDCFDFAAIQAKKPSSGEFTKLVEYMKINHPELALYVESTLEERFRIKLRKMGFREALYNNFSFYLLPMEK